MIRRDPTLIHMTDNDVQDIRDMLAARKAESPEKQNAKREGTVPPVPGFTVQEAAKKKKEAMTRQERLGLA